jgi:Tol biopolymer transport system component
MKTLKHILFIWLMLPMVALQAQNISLESLRDLPSVSGGVLSPDGNSLIYTVSVTDIERNSRRSMVYLLNLSNNQKTELGSGLSDYQWSPDGKSIAYRASKAGKQGIYVKAIPNGEEKLVAEYIQSNHFTGHPTKKNYAWSPDGKYIAYVAADPATGDNRSDANAPRVIERTMYKGRTTFSDNRITRIYMASVSGNEAPKAITSNTIDSHSLSWSPDSKQIAFLANHTENPDHNYNNDIFIYDIPSAQTKRLTDTQGYRARPQLGPKQRLDCLSGYGKADEYQRLATRRHTHLPKKYQNRRIEKPYTDFGYPVYRSELVAKRRWLVLFSR